MSLTYAELVEGLSKPIPSPGTFIGVRFTSDSVDMLHNLITFNGIDNPINLEELHSTLIFSRVDISGDEVAQPRSGLREKCVMKGYHIFQKEDGPPVLVVKLDSKYLSTRHEEIMDGTMATYDFPDYIPHVTLSYDFNGNIDDLLALPKTPLIIESEYSEEIDLDWG